MQKSFDLFFVSSNNHKYLEAKNILDTFGIKLGFYKSNLEEIQSNSIKEIALKKAKDAYSKCKKPVIIEDDVLIGANVVVLEGVKVGKGAVVAAGSIVVKNVEPYTVVAGVPAKMLKKVDDKTKAKTQLMDELRKL